MSRDDIIKMAHKAGFNWPEVHTTSIEDRLERFAALVAAAEREKLLGRPLNGLSQEQAKEWFKEVSKPMQQWPGPNWQYGCRVCNNGAQVGALGYVCPRSDCPTKITCEVSYE